MTVPVYGSIRTLSPTRNGLSSRMITPPKRFERTSWAASATAMPAIPAPAISGVIEISRKLRR